MEQQWQRILSRPPVVSAKSNILLSDHASQDNGATKTEWQQLVADAVKSIKRDEIQKVVLARSDSLTVDCCPGRILEYLRLRYPSAFLFAFARGSSCFFGASPERLVAFKEDSILTVALAGSAPRGENKAEDDQLGLSLLNSEKDRFEHDLVVRQLHALLNKHCDNIAVPTQPKLHKLMHIQHLLTPIEGQAKKGVSLLDVLFDLHPSAAVGGLPRQQALSYIRDNENLDRGWYAAPVGWLDANGEGEFAVALRSALITQGKVTLFAGCGLVKESVPAHEYHESCIKMNTIREAIRSVSLVR